MMNFKFACSYFACLTLLLIVLLGYIGWHGSDLEYRYYTAVRMHACDILKNDRSTLSGFDPDNCEVRRRPVWVGELIDVSCIVPTLYGDELHFRQTYGNGHVLFRFIVEKITAMRHGAHCNA